MRLTAQGLAWCQQSQVLHTLHLHQALGACVSIPQADAADTIFIVQRRDGDVMISPFAGPNRPEEATQEVAEQVRSPCFSTHQHIAWHS